MKIPGNRNRKDPSEEGFPIVYYDSQQAIFTCSLDWRETSSQRPEPTTETRWKNSSADKHRHPSPPCNTEDSFYSAHQTRRMEPGNIRVALNVTFSILIYSVRRRWFRHKGSEWTRCSENLQPLTYLHNKRGGALLAETAGHFTNVCRAPPLPSETRSSPCGQTATFQEDFTI